MTTPNQQRHRVFRHGDRHSFPIFKVLKPNGGSTFRNVLWPLPRGRKPGQWMEVTAGTRLQMCRHGLHLALRPEKWKGWHHRTAVYLVEYVGVAKYDGDTKICVRKARLLRQITWREALRLCRRARDRAGRRNP